MSVQSKHSFGYICCQIFYFQKFAFMFIWIHCIPDVIRDHDQIMLTCYRNCLNTWTTLFVLWFCSHMGALNSMKYGSLLKAIYKFTLVRQNYGKNIPPPICFSIWKCFILHSSFQSSQSMTFTGK